LDVEGVWEAARMDKQEFGPLGFTELQELFADAWTEFKASSQRPL
jgi:hypothetical protein